MLELIIRIVHTVKVVSIEFIRDIDLRSSSFLYLLLALLLVIVVSFILFNFLVIYTSILKFIKIKDGSLKSDFILCISFVITSITFLCIIKWGLESNQHDINNMCCILMLTLIIFIITVIMP